MEHRETTAGCRRLKDYHTTDDRNVLNTDPMYDFLTSQIAIWAICGVLIMCDTSQIESAIRPIYVIKKDISQMSI